MIKTKKIVAMIASTMLSHSVFAADLWNSATAYNAGEQVDHNGSTYEAKWWSQGFAPDTPVENDWDTPWALIASGGDAGAGDSGTDTGTGSTGTGSVEVNTWSTDQQYAAGDTVKFNGAYYEANRVTLGYQPDLPTPWRELSDAEVSALLNQGGSETGTGGTDTGTTTVEVPGSDVGTPLAVWPDLVFAPFVDATLYPTPRIADIAPQANTNYFVLGFVVAKRLDECVASWGTYYSITDGPTSWDENGEYGLYDQIKLVRDSGGDVMVSLGGAANTPLAMSCATETELAAQYKSLVDGLKLTAIDFDIEGHAVADHVGADNSVIRRAKAIKLLQDQLAAEGRAVKVWFTLPVLPDGLTHDGVTVLNIALENGVDLAGVNVMTMDYGDNAAPNPENQMGEYGIQAITSLHGQLRAAYDRAGIVKTDQELWAMVGTTPMIGMNDVTTEVFNLEDAQQTADFASENGIGLVSMWSINRDHACPDSTSVQLKCSSSPDQVDSYDFSQILGGYDD